MWSAREVEQGETAIERKVHNSNKKKKTRPTGTNQVRVGQEGEQPAASSLHIKGAVAIEKAKRTLLRNDPAESQVARWIFYRLCRYLLSHNANSRCSTAKAMFRHNDASSG